DLGREVIDRLIVLVDTGEPQVRDRVEFTQRSEDGDADGFGRNLGLTTRPQGLLDLLAEGSQLGWRDRSPLACLGGALDDLVSIERFRDAGALHDRELYLLDRGELPLAHGTCAASADGRAVLGRARVRHLGVLVATERTMH